MSRLTPYVAKEIFGDVTALYFPSIRWHAVTMQQKPPITIINVSGLPQPIARLLQMFVQALQRLLPAKRRATGTFDLLTKPGTVKGPINRRTIYEDVG